MVFSIASLDPRGPSMFLLSVAILSVWAEQETEPESQTMSIYISLNQYYPHAHERPHPDHQSTDPCGMSDGRNFLYSIKFMVACDMHLHLER